MSSIDRADPMSAFEPDGRGFLVRRGPAADRGEAKCEKKLCFTSTSLAPMAAVLYELSLRSDCWYTKFDATVGTHGMVRGRCFLTSEAAVIEVWRTYKVTDDLLCTVQDDEFINPRRDLP